MSEASVRELEERLCDFDPDARREALSELVRRRTRGEVELPARPGAMVNMHIHTFFSFNAEGWSPSRVAWEARKAGLLAAGTVDFDVLDGMDEFLCAADALSLRAAVGVESRVFVREYAGEVINSPGEPGVAYFMGTGFWRLPEPGSPGRRVLSRMRLLARKRNEEMAGRVNGHLVDASIDYDRDVLPLAPSGNATERHMLAAYEKKAEEVFPGPRDRARYWAGKLGEARSRVRDLMRDPVAFRELLRAKLMKKGGVGYAPPERGSFPALEEMIEMAASCGAVPTYTWLDGTNGGERPPGELVEFYASKGVVGWNIIPHRNWDLKDPEERRLNVRNLHEIVRAVRDANLILVCGTERNRHGQPFVDELDNEYLAPIAEAVREGALALCGHTALARRAGRPLGGEWARAAFGDDAASRNRFYAETGRLLEP